MYSVLYGHFSELKVRTGQTVKAGDVIGTMGNTGYSRGAHLHYGVVDGARATIWRLADMAAGNPKPNQAETMKFLAPGLFKSKAGKALGNIVTTKWLGYRNHYAIDAISSDWGLPYILWNREIQGKVVAAGWDGAYGYYAIIQYDYTEKSQKKGIGPSDLLMAKVMGIELIDQTKAVIVNDFIDSHKIKDVELIVQHKGIVYQPPLQGDVSWELNRRGAPGKLVFTTTEKLPVEKGSPVRLKIDGRPTFYGFLFVDKESKDKVQYTAYDQLRYFKNKETYVYEGKRLDQVVSMVAKDFRLQTGTLEPTGYVIPSRVEDNLTLFDIIGNATDETLLNAKRLYVLYDDFGKLTLRNVANMKVPLLIDTVSAEDFDKSESIDGNTYNKIKLYRDNKETGKREVYIAQSSANMNQWGILQLSEKVEEGTNAKQKADALLALYNLPEKKLSVKNVAGSLDVRAGTSLLVGVAGLSQWMMVEKVKHTFKNSEHVMDLTLRGGGFIV